MYQEKVEEREGWGGEVQEQMRLADRNRFLMCSTTLSNCRFPMLSIFEAHNQNKLSLSLSASIYFFLSSRAKYSHSNQTHQIIIIIIIIIFKLFNILMGLKLAHNFYFCMGHALWTLSSFEETIRFY